MRKTKVEVLEIIQKALNPKEEPITLDSTAISVPEWDSMGQVDVIIALDQAFDGAVTPLAAVADAASVKEIIGILEAHGMIETS